MKTIQIAKVLLYMVFSTIFVASCSKSELAPNSGYVSFIPTVNTASVSLITYNSAVSGGNISNDGTSVVSRRGVCWSTSQNPTIADSKTNDGAGTGSYTSSFEGLEAVTTYYIRAYATISQGTSYGNQLQFITGRGLPSLLLIDPWLDETETNYFSGGYIISDGGDAITARGVCWSTSPNPTTSDTKTTDGTGTVSYTSIITGINPATTYYIRAYATNSFGNAYSPEETFTTQ